MNTSDIRSTRFRIDDLVVDPGMRKLYRGEAEIELSRLSFDLLLAIADGAPNVMTTQALIEAVWQGTFVSDEAVTQRIKVLRDALCEQGVDKQHYIETVRGVGYRLRPDVLRDATNGESANGETADGESANGESPHSPPGPPGPPAAPGPGPAGAGGGEAGGGGDAGRERSFAGAGTVWRSRLALLGAAAVALIVAIVVLPNRPPPAEPASRSVAVLPFVALSTGSDDGYFADGLTEEILNALTQVPELLITARTSAFNFKGQDLPVTVIAERLGVAYLVDGTVRRDGDRLRVTARLVRANDGFHVWSESFDHDLTDSISIQIDIAERIAESLNVLLDDGQRARMRAAGLRDPAAFIAYQKGMERLNAAHTSGHSERMLELLGEANEYFEEAIARSPEFSDAYLQHADYYAHVAAGIASGQEPGGYSVADIDEIRAALLADFGEAIRYAPDATRRTNAELDRALLIGDWRNLSGRLQSVLAEQGCPAPIWFDVVALPYGIADGVAETIRSEVQCNPLDFASRVHEARFALWAQDFDAALEAASAGPGDPGDSLQPMLLGISLIGLGRFDEVVTLLEGEFAGADSIRSAPLFVAAAQGNATEARDLLDARRDKEPGSNHDPINLYAVIGDREAANRAAAEADGRPFGHMVLANSVLTCFCGAPFDLDATPRFARLIEQADLNWPPSSPIDWPLKDW